jgi:hypothetical protein
MGEQPRHQSLQEGAGQRQRGDQRDQRRRAAEGEQQRDDQCSAGQRADAGLAERDEMEWSIAPVSKTPPVGGEVGGRAYWAVDGGPPARLWWWVVCRPTVVATGAPSSNAGQPRGCAFCQSDDPTPARWRWDRALDSDRELLAPPPPREGLGRRWR